MQITQGQSERLLHNVHERYKTLIDLNVYHPMSITDIKAWCNNFTKPEHKLVAGYILDRIIYRSSSMAHSAYRSFMISTMRDIYAQYKGPEHLLTVKTWLKRLNSTRDKISDFYIAPVRLLTDSGASGDTVCRLVEASSCYTKTINNDGFQQANLQPTGIPSGKVILLVDDLLGGGKQIHDFSIQKNLQKWSEKNKVIYAPLISTVRGLNSARQSCPFLEIHPIELLEDEQHLFSFQVGKEVKILGENYLESLLIKHYEEMLDIYGMLRDNKKKKRRDRFGRDKMALALVFDWGCPNQTLPLLWKEPEVSLAKNSEWTRLFRRRGLN